MKGIVVLSALISIGFAEAALAKVDKIKCPPMAVRYTEGVTWGSQVRRNVKGGNLGGGMCIYDVGGDGGANASNCQKLPGCNLTQDVPPKCRCNTAPAPAETLGTN